MSRCGHSTATSILHMVVHNLRQWDTQFKSYIKLILLLSKFFTIVEVVSQLQSLGTCISSLLAMLLSKQSYPYLFL